MVVKTLTFCPRPKSVKFNSIRFRNLTARKQYKEMKGLVSTDTFESSGSRFV